MHPLKKDLPPWLGKSCASFAAEVPSPGSATDQAQMYGALFLGVAAGERESRLGRSSSSRTEDLGLRLISLREMISQDKRGRALRIDTWR